MDILQQIAFTLVLIIGCYLFYRQARGIYRNIMLGRKEDLTDRPAERWKKMLLIAFGQKKMFKRPIPAIFHFFIYAGFILINIEVLEIVFDGIFGTHRAFSPYLGGIYVAAIGFFELLAVLDITASIVFLSRRWIVRIKRFHAREMVGWPSKDATLILTFEITLMIAILLMNAADAALILKHPEEGHVAGYLVSSLLAPLLVGLSDTALIILERVAWWAHFVGILGFLNYLPKSKHLHIMLAFPNTYFSRLKPQAEFNNMPEITREIKAMMDPNAAYSAPEGDAAPPKFGAKDVYDLSWKNLLDAYSCTECGRCTSSCPANITGKLLSPRKIMMDTRDRLEEVGRNLDQHGPDYRDNKQLLGDYILVEELRACTTCQACVEECPVNINPLDIIVQMRRALIMEDSNSPEEWNLMSSNIENNAAPWQFSQQDRDKWVTELVKN
ncbi:MAG: (Fe-S)-binding protein [Chitinophagales bacterium]|nr:(Fe-S)-binding protein [Chitinophagales bacterium]